MDRVGDGDSPRPPGQPQALGSSTPSAPRAGRASLAASRYPHSHGVMGLWASSTAASIGIYTDRNVTPLTVENFNTWLASTRVVAQEGNLLRIAVPRQFNKDWLEAKLAAG